MISHIGNGSSGGYQNGGGGADFNSYQFKAQKEDFFSRKQNENSARPE